MSHYKPEIIKYPGNNSGKQIEVMLDKETVWLNQYQLAELFKTDRTSILRHIRNIYKSSELDENLTCAKIAQVQKEGSREIKRNFLFYNLDVILSVGYRVNSIRGTKFRIWATQILKEKLLQSVQTTKIGEKDLTNVARMIGRITEGRSIQDDQAIGLLQVITKYAYALDILDQYDYREIKIKSGKKVKAKSISYSEAINIINEMRKNIKTSNLFGKEKDSSLMGSLKNVFQTYSGSDLYPSIEEKAANLLYFLVKNHSFIDGNKRIAATLFISFLQKNNLLFKSMGILKIGNELLVALTLMVAESDPKEKELIVKVITNLLTDD
ncbi:MAG: virulence protein RhuM/Fic/DOC family protein [Ignavibacteriaceae bacterium]